MAIEKALEGAQLPKIELVDLVGAGPTDYQSALEFQRNLHQQVAAGERSSSLLLLEHLDVFTAGKRTEAHELPRSTTPVVKVDRGGKITWHGPGQLVGYPIIKLRAPQELVGYVREIEGAIIEILSAFELNGERVEGRSGVWIEKRRKIAAIGIRVAQGVTMHGFAINSNCSLDSFNEIIPCGINDAEVTSISRELHREVSIAEILPIVQEKMLPVLAQMTAWEKSQ